jgi:ketosteroid isomerase-like protein
LRKRNNRYDIKGPAMKLFYGLATSLLAVVATAGFALGQTPKKMGKMMNHEDAATTIAVMDHVWLNAASNNDATTAAWLFADDFVEIHPGGDIVDRTQQINQIKDSSRKFDEIHPDDIDVRYAAPDVAMLLDTTTIRGPQGGVNYGGKYKVIRVFIKDQGRWRAVGAGIAPIMP